MCCMQKKNQTDQTWKSSVQDKFATRENGGLLWFPRMDCAKKDMHDDMACDINNDSVCTGETAPGFQPNPRRESAASSNDERSDERMTLADSLEAHSDE